MLHSAHHLQFLLGPGPSAADLGPRPEKNIRGHLPSCTLLPPAKLLRAPRDVSRACARADDDAGQTRDDTRARPNASQLEESRAHPDLTRRLASPPTFPLLPPAARVRPDAAARLHASAPPPPRQGDVAPRRAGEASLGGRAGRPSAARAVEAEDGGVA